MLINKYKMYGIGLCKIVRVCVCLYDAYECMHSKTILKDTLKILMRISGSFAFFTVFLYLLSVHELLFKPIF